MKNCPTCKRIYRGNDISFCLDDGSLLVTIHNSQETKTVVKPLLIKQRDLKPYLFIAIGMLALSIIGFGLLRLISNSANPDQPEKIYEGKYNPYKGLVKELLPKNIKVDGNLDSVPTIFNFKEKMPNPNDGFDDLNLRNEIGFVDVAGANYRSNSSPNQQEIGIVIFNFNSSEEATEAILKISQKEIKLLVGDKYKDNKKVGRRIALNQIVLYSNGSLLVGIRRIASETDLADIELNLPF